MGYSDDDDDDAPMMVDKRKTKVVTNQPFDEALDVSEGDDIMSSASSPMQKHEAPRGGHARGRNVRGDTPPEPLSDNEDDDEYGEEEEEEEDEDMPKQVPSRPKPADARAPQGLGSLGGGGQPRGLGGQPRGHAGMYAGDGDDEEDEEHSQRSHATDEEGHGEDDDGEGEEGESKSQPVERGYDPEEYKHLPVSSEIKELFQYITRYMPITLDLDHRLRPFIPDYIPAVGDIDAFVKVQRPDDKPSSLGLTVVDEPCAAQSDPTVLDLQLRTLLKQASAQPMSVRSLEHAEKNPKQIDGWIKSIAELHRQKPAATVNYSKRMPDVDQLMQEWPPEFEDMLKSLSLPTADLNVDIKQYVELVCSILDIPVYKSKIESLHLLFSVFSEFKNSQHFKQREAAEDEVRGGSNNDRIVRSVSPTPSS
eukprot:Opistho-2@21702